MRALILALALVGCSGEPAPPPAFVVHSADPGLAELRGGTYLVSWDIGGCDELTIEWAPHDMTYGTTVIEAVPDEGEVEVDLPSGRGYLNRAAICERGAEDYTVRLEAVEWQP